MKLLYVGLFIVLEVQYALPSSLQGFSDSCDDYRSKGFSLDGVYRIFVKQKYIKVFCEFDKENPKINWLVFQKRTNPNIDFYKPWESYKKGFGDYENNFWLGLENLHDITETNDFMLRIDVMDYRGRKAHAEYKSFKIGDEKSDYVMNVAEFTGGNAGDSLTYHNNCSFSTFDRDHDSWGGNCAVVRHGGWWYKKCSYANLNGKYFSDNREEFSGIYWYRWNSRAWSLKEVEMKIRPEIYQTSFEKLEQ